MGVRYGDTVRKEEQLHDLYCLTDTINAVISRGMEWAERIVCIE
jgi:hypothetical protein